MGTSESFQSQLYDVNGSSFDNIALDLFRHQAFENPVYRDFLKHLGTDTLKINSVLSIPFMPVSFFKRHTIKTGAWTSSTVFTSSGTSGQTPSVHHVDDMEFYLKNSEHCFRHFFGELTDYNILALLPSYLERENSSLVTMIDHFIRESKSPFSGFYLHNKQEMLRDLEKLRGEGRKTILWGVSFALLDLAEETRPDLSHCMVFETGGMKGRRKEMTRQELHDKLCKGLNVNKIYSEYGMTELFSQAYTAGANRFYCPPWMKIVGRDVTDPFRKGLLEETCGINVIDLANFRSIAFIEIEDVGKVFADGSFEVLGRLDNSDVRGCNLLVE